MTFKELFKGQRPIIGVQDCGCNMQHSTYDKMMREIDIFIRHDVSPLIMNVFGRGGSVEDCKDALAYICSEYPGAIYGISIPERWDYAFYLADEFNASFVYIDEINAKFTTEDKFIEDLMSLRERFKSIIVLGSMYYPRYSGLGFEGELLKVSQCCDAIVYLGDREDVTMMNGKVEEIKTVLKDFPVLMGEDFAEDQCMEGYLRGDGAVLDAWLKDYRSVRGNVNEDYVAEIVEANQLRAN